MLTLVFGLKRCCSLIKPHTVRSVAVDSQSCYHMIELTFSSSNRIDFILQVWQEGISGSSLYQSSSSSNLFPLLSWKIYVFFKEAALFYVKHIFPCQLMLTFPLMQHDYSFYCNFSFMKHKKSCICFIMDCIMYN